MCVLALRTLRRRVRPFTPLRDNITLDRPV
jgi:hypothetical protein